MRLRLVRDSRILVKAGEIVEVSPDVARFLLSVGSAVPEAEKKETASPKTAKKKKD